MCKTESPIRNVLRKENCPSQEKQKGELSNLKETEKRVVQAKRNRNREEIEVNTHHPLSLFDMEKKIEKEVRQIETEGLSERHEES